MALTTQPPFIPESVTIASSISDELREALTSKRASNNVSNGEIKIRSRGYQLEMLEASMKRNVIIAMDTGSGKTHIAILRIMAELDRCPPEKLVWFLAPSVALCQQQFEVIQKQLPAVRVKKLTGSDNVEHWSEQRIWDAVLDGVQVVVSTHAVLADALSHGFVTMARLALLVFDEAHSCTRGHPANKIMRDFYHPKWKKSGSTSVPHILGLTASPVQRSKLGDLGHRTIESNLASIATTPRINRSELMEYVFPPAIQKIEFKPSSFEVDIGTTPNFFHLLAYEAVATRRLPDPQNQTFQILIDPNLDLEGYRWIETQLKKFCGKAQHVFEEVGPWGVEYYIATSIKHYIGVRSGDASGYSTSKKRSRKKHLSVLLERIPITDPSFDITTGEAPLISQKSMKLFEFLTEEQEEEYSGLIFVEQRATVFTLSWLFSNHPLTRSKFTCGSFVGSINSANELGDLDPRGQETTLEDFRLGRKNLVIATSVLEEGIDVSACNVVICFEKPKNLKSFVQRRGRARKEKSLLVAMLPEGDVNGSFEKWHALEEEMINVYCDEMRTLLATAEIENTDEEDDRVLFVESTQACLTLESAVPHLEHFCATLPSGNFVNNRPAYSFVEKSGRITCIVTLPNSVDSSLRRASSRLSWRTERKAKKDAAFEAYMSLYNAGLVNDNLLPLYSQLDLEPLEEIEKRPGMVEASPSYDPWIDIAQEWNSTASSFQSKELRITQSFGKTTDLLVKVNLVLPCSIPPLSVDLFVDESRTYHAHIIEDYNLEGPTEYDIQTLRSTTNLIFRSVPRNEAAFGNHDFAVMFSPVEQDCASLGDWLAQNTGRRPISEAYLSYSSLEDVGLVDHPGREKSILLATRVDDGDLQLCLRPIPKRRNFLTRGTALAISTVPDEQHEKPISSQDNKSIWVPSDDSYVYKLPAKYATFSLVVPSILHRLQVVMTALHVQERVLRSRLHFKSLDLLITAISAPMASEVSNYQRLEFLGDTILKFLVARSLFAENDRWHEGYLSASKDRIVSNGRLAKAAIEKELDRFILTTPFTGRKWKPPLISELLKNSSQQQEKRWMSTKVLADVVEAIIGAAYLDDGRSYGMAITCVKTFLPEVKIDLLPTYAPQAGSEISLPLHLQNLERLIDYTFLNKSLLIEAMMHPSCDADLSHASYQRLEFLGDAVLDMILVDYLFHHPQSLSETQMHLLKSAVANKDFLSFLCLEASVSTTTLEIVERSKHSRTFVQVPAPDTTYLWQFMRHHSVPVSQAQTLVHEKYLSLRDSIRQSLAADSKYPWCMLLNLNAEKFFSDIIESIFGAVFLDTRGDLNACRYLAERLGIMPYLRRFADDGVEMRHPKTRLGMLAGVKTVEYERVEMHVNGEKRLYCAVLVGEVEAVRVEWSVSREETEARAAEAAIDFLEGGAGEAERSMSH